MKFWAGAEPLLTFDNLWAPAIRQGMDKVRAKLPLIPEKVAPEEAQKIWRDAATAMILASNEAGLTAAKVGGFDFPAWRLKYAVKYFKATLKDAIVDYWDTPRLPAPDWVLACKQLGEFSRQLPAEMNDFLNSLPK